VIIQFFKAPVTTHRIHVVVIVIVAAFFYAITMPTTITLEDAGLFQMVCHLDGISHPPGYPLFTILCNQMTLAPGVVTGNLISVVFALVAVVLFYEVVVLITANEFTALLQQSPMLSRSRSGLKLSLLRCTALQPACLYSVGGC